MAQLVLAGNQNSGKTTLFNALTGSNQHVGNFPGVTVEKKIGKIKRQKEMTKRQEEMTLVDLPGIYSLSPYTSEEVVTRDFLLESHPDAIINIVDATNLERNLYLSLQLMELRIPMIIALNMMDEVRSSGNSIDIEQLSEALGVPVVPIAAAHNEGISELMSQTRRIVEEKQLPKRNDFCGGSVHKAIHAIAHLIEEKAQKANYPVRYAATKMVEGDALCVAHLQISAQELHVISHIVEEMEQDMQMDREAAMADMRYTFIESACKTTVHKHQETKEQQRSEKMDRWLTHKYFGIPIFLGLMLLIFYLTFDLLGAPLQGLLEEGIAAVSDAFSLTLQSWHVSEVLHSLVIDGIFNGVGSVLSFLPIIVLLFFFLSLLEDSGYMARVAFVMDKALRRIGLSGRSFVPMLIGFGCSVPAIMATRTLSSERDRKMTIMLTPFMSCSAKLPIYGMITMAFFANHSSLVMIGLYILGIVVAIISGLLLKNTMFKGKPVPFVMELPAYRVPSAHSVLLHMWEKGKDFIQRAFTVIFIATIVIWFLQSFDFGLNMVQSSADSMLARFGSMIAVIFAPLGFSSWMASTALITGITAKEAVVSTLSVLTNASSDAMLSTALTQMFTPLSAISFLAFTLLYMPCAAAFAATKRELGSWKGVVLTAAFQTGVAYVVAMLIYQIGSLIW